VAYLWPGREGRSCRRASCASGWAPGCRSTWCRGLRGAERCRAPPVARWTARRCPPGAVRARRHHVGSRLVRSGATLAEIWAQVLGTRAWASTTTSSSWRRLHPQHPDHHPGGARGHRAVAAADLPEPHGGRLAAVANHAPSCGPSRVRDGPGGAAVPIQRWFFAQAPGGAPPLNMSLFLEVRGGPWTRRCWNGRWGTWWSTTTRCACASSRLRTGWRQVSTAPGSPCRWSAWTCRASSRGPGRGAGARATRVIGLAAAGGGAACSGGAVRPRYGTLRAPAARAAPPRVDGVSWRILLEDLLTCTSARAGASAGCHEDDLLPGVGPGPLRAARSGSAGGRALLVEGGPWSRVTRLPWTCRGANTEGSARNVTPEPHRPRRRARCCRTCRARTTRRSTTRFSPRSRRTVGQWAGNSRVLVDVEGHGARSCSPGLDVSRTVGWFTTYFPALLDCRTPRAPVRRCGP
jgi:hypothetical protein